MAGIYIPEMKMPECCGECVFLGKDDYPFWCGRNGLPVTDEDLKRRRNDCDLREVPDHGRLVDADAFRKEMDKHYPFDKLTQSKHGEADAAKGTILLMLAEAPTVIPADKEVQTC